LPGGNALLGIAGQDEWSRRVAKRRKKTFKAAREARRRAREVAGNPPPARFIPDKRSKSPKHRKPPHEEAEL
jgi:hypothetical protein